MGANPLIIAATPSRQADQRDTVTNLLHHLSRYHRVRALAGTGLLLLVFAGACRKAAEAAGPGHLDARWTGADTGMISGPARAEWCDEHRLLQIRAIQGDTGLALAIYPGVILSPDSYKVVAPTGRDSVVPSARVALRWFGKTSINGFQGDSGTVVLEQTDSGELSGRVTARASSVSSSGRLRLSGQFRKLDVVSATRGCIPEPAPDSSDEELIGDDSYDVD